MRPKYVKDEQYFGIFTYLTAGSALAEYYTTVSANEIIRFTEADGTQIYLDNTLVENCGASVMYVLPLNGIHPICIPAGENRNIDEAQITGIQIMGNAGQKLRYSGCYY